MTEAETAVRDALAKMTPGIWEWRKNTWLQEIKCGSLNVASSGSKRYAASIRALIADLRAGNLVRREDVVAELRRRAAMPQPCPDCPRWEPNVSLNLAADAIAAGAHEGGGR